MGFDGRNYIGVFAGIDPATGLPVYEARPCPAGTSQVPAVLIGSDPVTGEPVYLFDNASQLAGRHVGLLVGSDPVTGEPVYLADFCGGAVPTTCEACAGSDRPATLTVTLLNVSGFACLDGVSVTLTNFGSPTRLDYSAVSGGPSVTCCGQGPMNFSSGGGLSCFTDSPPTFLLTLNWSDGICRLSLSIEWNPCAGGGPIDLPTYTSPTFCAGSGGGAFTVSLSGVSCTAPNCLIGACLKVAFS